MDPCLGKRFWSGLGVVFSIVGATSWGCSWLPGHNATRTRDWWGQRVRVVDLTYTFGPDTIYWPTSEPFSLEPVRRGFTAEGYWYAANNLRMAEHGGTHMDAPLHFGEGQAAADQVPVESLIGPAAVIDVRRQASENPDYQLQVEDILAWERSYGRVPQGAFVIMRSGWGQYWGDAKRYLGSDRPGDVQHLHFPGFSPRAAEFLVHERQVAAIGVDTASIDPGPSREFPVHRILAAANKPAFENLANVNELPATGALIIALPLKVAGGSGGPARVIALIPQR